jgi:hydroxymethylbilane synthase
MTYQETFEDILAMHGITYPRSEIRIATRGSALALEQTAIVARLLGAYYANPSIEIVTLTTAGDANQSTPIAQIADGAFVRGVEAALLEGRADIAVHSAKDVPTTEPPGLTLAAFPARADPRDAIISRDGLGFAELPSGARLGTSSPRRAAIARSLRPDLDVVSIRGNVDTRLRKLRAGEYDAIVLAAAGLARMGLHEQVTEYCDPAVWVPAAGQGAIAVQCRADDPAERLLAHIDEPSTHTAIIAERVVLRRLGSGCRTPVGIYATATDYGGDWYITVSAALFTPDGRRTVIVRTEGEDDAEQVGTLAADDLLRRASVEL